MLALTGIANPGSYNTAAFNVGDTQHRWFQPGRHSSSAYECGHHLQHVAPSCRGESSNGMLCGDEGLFGLSYGNVLSRNSS